MYNTQIFGKVCLKFNQIPSTNSFALELIAKENPEEGTLIMAANQTAGRGQFGRPWHDQPNTSLLASYIAYPHFLAPTHTWYLSIAVALAVHKTVADLSDATQTNIKWPNDILLSGQKIAGILIENNLDTQGKLANSVIGIGINVRQTSFPNVVPNATSLYIATGRFYDLDEVAARLSHALDIYYDRLRADRFDALLEDYTTHLFGLHQPLQYMDMQTNLTFEAQVVGINEAGRLRLASNGSERTYTHGSIRLVQEMN